MARIYSKKFHCLNGHEKTPDNTDSNYSCKLCKSMRDAARHPRLTKVCAWCACEFTGRADQDYCNRKCLDKAKKRRKSKVTDKRREELHVEAEKRSAWKLDHPGERWYAYKTMSSEEKKAYHRKNREAGSLEQRRAKARRKAKSSAGKARSAANRHRRRARIKGNGGSWTGKQWVALKAAHEGKCLGCGRTETEVIAMGRKLVPDHIKPLSLGGANSIENLQPLCHGDGSSCNMLKSARWIDYRPGFPLEIA